MNDETVDFVLRRFRERYEWAVTTHIKNCPTPGFMIDDVDNFMVDVECVLLYECGKLKEFINEYKDDNIMKKVIKIWVVMGLKDRYYELVRLLERRNDIRDVCDMLDIYIDVENLIVR